MGISFFLLNLVHLNRNFKYVNTKIFELALQALKNTTFLL